MSKQLFLLVALFTIASCGATTTTATQSVKNGMSQTRVTGMLGEPRNRSFDGTHEAWLYADPIAFGRCAYVSIWFENDKVVAMNNRTRGCFGHTVPPGWDQMPEAAQSVSETNEGRSTTVSGPAPERDKFGDLERLKKLLDDGTLTQEEFDVEKAKILNE